MKMTAILDSNVAEMVDLAINYPEMGCVDFNMLLNVLHILIYKLELKEKPVEVHSDETLVPPLQPANTIKVSELYAEEAGKETGDTILVVKRDSRTSAGEPMFVRKEPADTIESRREKLETSSTPGFESTRLDAIDEEIAKLKLAIGKLASDSGIFRESLTALIRTGPKKVDQETASRYEDSHKSGADAIQDKAHSDTEKKVSTADLDADLNSGRIEVTRDNTGSQTLYEHEIDDRTQSQNKDTQIGQDKTESHLQKKDTQVDEDRAHSQVQHGDMSSRIDQDRTRFQEGEADLGKLSGGDNLMLQQETEQLTETDLAPLSLWKKIRLLELKVQKCCDQMSLQTASQDISGALDASSRRSPQGHRSYLSSQDQIVLLHTLQENLDELARNMAEKADLRHLARKVSNEQFEFVCDDIARTITDTLNKINTQEELWQLALDDVQRYIETKLDKMELAPMKEFFNDKFRTLQANLNKMADLRREVEAAGTTKKLMRGLNCIACDANTAMNTKAAPTIPVSKPAHAQMSIKPYLTYELDAVRKARANAPKNRNLHDWEILDKQMRQPVKVRSATDKHLCSRYCGGSHTVTTPYQRVARLGHFLQQWGPECFPLSQSMAAGDVQDSQKLKGEKTNQEKRPHSPVHEERKKLKIECTCAGTF